MGVPDEQVATEEFVSPKSNVPAFEPSTGGPIESSAEIVSSSTIRFELSSQTLDVHASTTILEAAEQAGVALPWECRAGICGQCKVRCTSGRVRMDSRDALSKAEDANGFILACQSHPVTDSVSIEA